MGRGHTLLLLGLLWDSQWRRFVAPRVRRERPVGPICVTGKPRERDFPIAACKAISPFKQKRAVFVAEYLAQRGGDRPFRRAQRPLAVRDQPRPPRLTPLRALVLAPRFHFTNLLKESPQLGPIRARLAGDPPCPRCIPLLPLTLLQVRRAPRKPGHPPPPGAVCRELDPHVP